MNQPEEIKRCSKLSRCWKKVSCSVLLKALRAIVLLKDVCDGKSLRSCKAGSPARAGKESAFIMHSVLLTRRLRLASGIMSEYTCRTQVARRHVPSAALVKDRQATLCDRFRLQQRQQSWSAGGCMHQSGLCNKRRKLTVHAEGSQVGLTG